MAASVLSASAETPDMNHTEGCGFLFFWIISAPRGSLKPKGGGFLFTGLVRTIILYLFIIAGVRLMGKRQVGELEPSELVVSLIVADLAAVPMQDYGIPLLTGLLPIVALLALTMILSVLTMRSMTFRALLCGKPSVIIRAGELDVKEMARNRLTADELLEDLRAKGVADPSQVWYAVLETNGQLSVLPRSAQKPPTNQQLGHKTDDSPLPTVLISDGRVLEENLSLLGRDRKWLKGLLKGADPAGVFLLLSDGENVVYRAMRSPS